MSRPDATSRKTIVVDIAAPLGLVLGVLLGQILLSVLVGLPGLLASAVAGALGAGDRGVDWSIVVSIGIGAVTCAAIGVMLGKRREATWWFIAGVDAVAAYGLMTSIAAGGLLSGTAMFVAVPYAIAGTALALGYWSGRRKRAASEACAETTGSVPKRVPLEQARPADGVRFEQQEGGAVHR